MTQAIHIMAVDAMYSPIAGQCLNLICKFEGRYVGVNVGDHAIVHHTNDPETKNEAMATEMLKVSAMAVGSFDDIVSAHGRFHHSQVKSLKKLRDRLVSQCYENGEVNHSDKFVAIYF